MKRSRVFENDADNWYRITDPKERKKVQDRLAQRARRRRLAEGKEQKASTRPATTPSDPASHTNDESSKEDVTGLICKSNPQARQQCLHQMTLDISAVRRYFKDIDAVGKVPVSSLQYLIPLSASPNSVVQDPLADTALISLAPITIYAALWINGQPLGLTCAANNNSQRSRAEHRTAKEVPASLRPSELQVALAHPVWIDRFPFPKFRDNMILYEKIVDVDKFLEDLFGVGSFILKPGAPSWDPRGWMMYKGFAERWGYLFV